MRAALAVLVMAAALPGPARAQAADPSRPAGVEDLALSAVSGYAPAFIAAGLRARRLPDGSAVILRRDGSRASPAEIEGLKARILAEPAALARRPDFYAVISRSAFQELKLALAAAARPAFYRDAVLSPDGRDIVRASSCGGDSPQCAPFAAGSYRKGDLVPPEELKTLWFESRPSSRRAPPPAPEPRPGRFGSVVAALREMFGLPGTARTGASGAVGTAASVSVIAVLAKDGTGAPLGGDPATPRDRSTAWAVLVAAACGAGLVALRRRRG